ncbi:MAG: transcriptional activator NhaR [Verrucomicrobiales bacterium]|nr:transcriptional activator NhaR [Verrucomicrobiales bacterium]
MAADFVSENDKLWNGQCGFPEAFLNMDWLNYHHLRYFWTVAREGSLARAASVLNVSQPSISGQIRELETAVGQPLFRRQGRNNILTETGQLVQRYANDIFLLGGELMNELAGGPAARALRVRVGLTDSFPRLVANEILRPLFLPERPVHIVCRDGKAEELLTQLAAHRLDVVLAEEAPPGSASIRVFDHPLGSASCLFAASDKLAGRLRPEFPESLAGAPALFPAESSPMRRVVETWCRVHSIRPRLVAEFDDPGLMKVMAAEGRGFLVLPATAAASALKRYGLHVFGMAADCRVSFHAYTGERRTDHPAVTELLRSKAWMVDSP